MSADTAWQSAVDLKDLIHWHSGRFWHNPCESTLKRLIGKWTCLICGRNSTANRMSYYSNAEWRVYCVSCWLTNCLLVQVASMLPPKRSLGGKVWKTLSVGHRIFGFSKKNNGQAFSDTFALRLYNSHASDHCPLPVIIAMITAHGHMCTCARPAHVAKSERLAILQVLQNRGSHIIIRLGFWCKELKSCQREIATDKIQERKNILEVQQ